MLDKFAFQHGRSKVKVTLAILEEKKNFVIALTPLFIYLFILISFFFFFDRF